MGKGSSKQSKLYHLQQQQVTGDGKNIDETKQGNNSLKINNRNTYVPYGGQKILNAADKNDPARTDDEKQKPVQDETGDLEDDPPYNTLDPEEISTIAEMTTPEYANYTAERRTPEYANYTAERTTPEYANYTAGSPNEERIQDTERQTNKHTAGSPNEERIQDPERQTNKPGSPNEERIQDPERQTNKHTAGSPNEERIQDPERQTNKRTAGSPNEERIQDLERQTNKHTEDNAEFRKSTAYVNLTFLREQGLLPKRKKSRHPECEAELASIRRHYRELKKGVCIQNICDYLIQDGVLLESDWDNIMLDSYSRQERVDVLLQIMLRKTNQQDFKAFNRALRKTGCEDLADKLENTEVKVPDKSYMRQWTSKEVLNAWPGIEEYLIDELQPEYILDFFLQENIFSVDEYETVFWPRHTREMMTKKLLEIVKNKLPEALFVLLFALNEDNKNMVKELEKLFAEGKDEQEAPENCRTKPSNTDVRLVAVHEASSLTVQFSPTPVCTVKLNVEQEGIAMNNVEIQINNFVNNDDGACLLQVFLPPTGCEIIKSELGCVIIYLRPHSHYACHKLSAFCQSGGLKDFVLSLMRETDIFSSLPDGEVCVNIQVQYHVGELEAEDAKEINTVLTQSIKDNWSFLCEELDVKSLIRRSLHKAVFTDDEIAKFNGRTAINRHKDADNFLKCLLKKGPAGIQFLMDALKEKPNLKIINRLQKSDPIYRNPKVIKENLIVHFESIVQEIDPSQFMDTFVDRNILDRKFFTDLRENHLRRRCRAALFLKEVLNKGSRAIYAFVDVMVDIGYEELVVKLVSVEDNLLESNQQESVDDRKDDTVKKVADVSSPEGLTWSCCMKINVEKKGKDETKQQMFGSSSKNEEPIYMNVMWNDVDEGIGGAEADSLLTLRSKEGLSQTNRPVTHPEISVSHYVESDLDKCLTYPRIKESDEVKKGMRSLNISKTRRDKNDSGIDISISK